MLFIRPEEITVLLDWYEFYNDDSFHYGGEVLIIPAEGILVEKIQSHADAGISITDDDVHIVADWMEKALQRKYGSAIYALPVEKMLYDKISGMMKALDTASQEPHGSPSD